MYNIYYYDWCVLITIDSSDKMVNTRLYVGGISNEITREHLQDLFGKYGKCEHVWVAFNPPGFAFVNFETEADASNACDALNGQVSVNSDEYSIYFSIYFYKDNAVLYYVQ